MRFITRFHRFILIMTVVVVNSFVIFMLCYGLAQAKRQQEREVRTAIENMALLVNSNIAGSTSQINFALRESAEALQRELATAKQLDARRVNAALATHMGWISDLAELRVTDASGTVRYGIGIPPNRQISYADRTFFAEHRGRDDTGLIVANPRYDDISKLWKVAFTRRYNDPQGRFAGVISAVVPVSYFAQFLAELKLGPNGVALLRDANAALVARYPAVANPAQQTGTSIYSKELAAIIQSGVTAQTYHTLQTGDGIERINTYRRLSTLPFHLVIGMAADDYLGNWRNSIRDATIVAIIFLIFSTLFGWMLWHSFTLTDNERKRSRLLVRRASDGIHILDKLGFIREASDSYCRMLQYHRTEVIGMHITDCDAHFARATLQESMARQFARQEVSTFETRHIRKDGGFVEVEVTSYPLELDGEPMLYCASRDISERKRLVDQLHTLARAVEQSPVSIVITDRKGNIEYVNSRFTEITGYAADEVIGQNPRILRSDQTPHPTYEALWTCLLNGKAWHGTFRNRRKNGELFWEDASISPILNEHNEITHFVAVKEDITERRAVEDKLQLAASVFTDAREGITITDADGTIIEVNDAFTRITGYDRDDVIGKNPRILRSGRHRKSFYTEMWRDLIDKGHWYGEIWNRRKNGDVYAQMLTISAVRDKQGNTRQYVALFSDITKLKEYQKQLEHIAHYDALTGLPNRVMLANSLQMAMAQTRRRAQRLAVAYLDLDQFKPVNDNHGHEVGDQLLIALAKRMKQALRAGDMIARMGGDEFVAVLLDLSEDESSVPMLTRLLAAAAQPVHVGTLDVQVSASMGVTFFPQAEEVDADQLLRQADQAMYQAKQTGKNRYHIFDADQDRSVRGHHESLEHIRIALNEQQFVLHYQPKVNMRSGEVIGAEALIRWQHPERGMLSPAAFLPTIENHRLAVELGEWVIDTALTDMAAWRRAGLNIPVSVNVSAIQLQDDQFVNRLREILSMHAGVRAGDLELEVLETSALEDLEHVSQIITACREIGVSFSLDDFGTGYSSLTYLKRLPVALLKIDRSFVRDMLDDPEDLAILEGVLGLASAFNRQVIAEGVETLEHGDMLLQLGCELAQGYCIARPMPADQLHAWASNWQPPPGWGSLKSMRREDLPVLFAAVEHRAWIAAVENYLSGRREVPPQLDIHHCRFGMWLDRELARQGDRINLQEIDRLHRQIHALVTEMCDLQAQERNAEAMEKVGGMYRLRDALLGSLRTLFQDDLHRMAVPGERHGRESDTRDIPTLRGD